MTSTDCTGRLPAGKWRSQRQQTSQCRDHRPAWTCSGAGKHG